MHSRPYPWQTFVDGVVYHDYHFNGMQLAIAKELKQNYVDNHYSSRLLIHPEASYVWFDPLVSKELIETMDGAQFDESRLAITSASGTGRVVWTAIDLPEPTSGVDLLWSAEAPELITFEVTFNGGLTWKPAPIGERVRVDDAGGVTDSVRIRAALTSGPNADVRLYDVAVFF